MKIKNKKLVSEFIFDMMVNVGGGEDGVVGLNEMMNGMYGKIESVSKLKKDILNEFGIKIGVNEENEEVYVLCGDEDDEG